MFHQCILENFIEVNASELKYYENVM